MREAAVEDRVVHLAEKAGFFVRKVSWVGRKSAPDRVFSHEDRGTVWIEFKKPGETPTVLQSREHERMRKAGMEVWVCDNAADAVRILGLLPGDNEGPTLVEGWEDLI